MKPVYSLVFFPLLLFTLATAAPAIRHIAAQVSADLLQQRCANTLGRRDKLLLDKNRDKREVIITIFLQNIVL